MSRGTSRFVRYHGVRHHRTRHHHIRNRDVRCSPGHTPPLMAVGLAPASPRTTHYTWPTTPRSPPPPPRLPDASAIYSWRGKHSHRTASHHPLYRNGYLLFAPPPGPRLVHRDMHRDMHALPDREGAPPSRFRVRVRVLRPRLCRVLCQQRGRRGRPGRVPETGESCSVSTARPQRPDASSVSGQRSVCALCCAAYCVCAILRCVLCPPFPPPAPYINTPWLSLLC